MWEKMTEIDPVRQAAIWENDFAYHGGDEGITQYHVICAILNYLPRLNVWRGAIFYDGYKMPGIKGDIYRVDLDLPVEEFTGKSAQDIAAFSQQYVDCDISKYREDALRA